MKEHAVAEDSALSIKHQLMMMEAGECHARSVEDTHRGGLKAMLATDGFRRQIQCRDQTLSVQIKEHAVAEDHRQPGMPMAAWWSIHTGILCV